MIRTLIATLFFIMAAFLFVTEVIGLYKFDYVLSRIHAAALGDTFGLLFTALGVIVLKGFRLVSLKLLLIPVFFYLTGPELTHLIGKVEILDHRNRGHEYEEVDRT